MFIVAYSNQIRRNYWCYSWCYLVTPEESFRFQGLVWNIQQPEVIIAALKDHTHGLCRQPCRLEIKTYMRQQ